MVQPLMQTVGERRTGIHAGGCPQRYLLDDRGRRLMQETYDGKPETIDKLERLLGVPRWTEQELDYLQRQLYKMSLGNIAKKLGRTKVAVQVKAKRLGIAKSDRGYTMCLLCDCLGCDHHKVERWLRSGWLKGIRRQTERESLDMWYFSDEAIRKFIVQHPEEIDQRRVGWLWVVDLLTGGLGALGEVTA